MSVVRRLFGPSKDEIWRQLAAELKAEFVEGRWFKESKVQAHVGEWTVTLDTYTVSSGNSHVTYTRMRAPYVNRDGFRFKIYRKGILSSIGALFGMQDVEVGDAEFDRQFVVKGNDESKLRMLCMNERVRSLMMEQKEFLLQVKDDEGWFGAKFPEGVDELSFQVTGVIKDLDRLKNLYELFAVTLHQLCHIGSAYENDPNLVL